MESSAAAAPPKWTNKLNTEKGRTSKRNEIVFLPPTGDTLRRSPRLSKLKPSETPENEQAKKHGKKSSSSKEGNRKDSNDEETKACNEEKSDTPIATARMAGETETSDVVMEKAEDGRKMNNVANGEVLLGGESGNIIEEGLNDVNKEKITKNTEKMMCLESGNEMDFKTKEEEVSTTEKQTAAETQDKDEQIVLGEFNAPPVWTKEVTSIEVPCGCLFGICSTVQMICCKAIYDLKDMLIPEKGQTSKINEIIFISPTGEVLNHKKQLKHFLKSIPEGDYLRRSPRLSKSKPLETPEIEPAKKRGKKSSSSKEGNEKDNGNKETEASDEGKRGIATARVSEGTQVRLVAEMEKAEDGRERNEEVPNSEVLPGRESSDITVAGSKDENEEKNTKSSRKTMCLETGNKMDSNTKEEEVNTAEEQTKIENQEKEEQIVFGELHAPLGWAKKLIPEKSHTSKRNEIVFISPTREKIKNKRLLNRFLKSNPGVPASSEFYWGEGYTIHSPRLSSPENKPPKKRGRKSSSNRSSVSEFGEDRFSVGKWVHKDFVSRDDQMKLGTHAFFASIDQRSESAGGESACTVLVVVIANWLQTNHDSMPTDSQFDNLIREGSLEWRNLCAEETIKKRFPDKHLDLQTVLQANIRPVSIASEKSFVGFFIPDGIEEGAIEFLVQTMSFDCIWDEISSCAGKNCLSGGGPEVYIVSWNNHFFILKVEAEAYYLVDTLGERLCEGCDQAYILKFDKDTTIHRLHEEVVKETETVDQLIMAEAEKETDTVPQQNLKEDLTAKVESGKKEDMLCKGKESGKQEDIVCQGKESCKEYIKSFLAAIPIRELQVHIKEGVMALEDHLQRLQIEFHYVEFLLPKT